MPYTLPETNIDPLQGIFKDVFPFTKVGYVSCEGGNWPVDRGLGMSSVGMLQLATSSQAQITPPKYLVRGPFKCI